MAQLITVRLNKSSQEPLGFRLQGGKDFGTPLVVQKVNGGSAAERAGLQAGDALIKVNATDVFTLRHQEAQDTIRAAGPSLELVVQRGGGTWRPSVTPTGSLPRPGSRALGASPLPVTSTSLKATQQPSRPFGSGHNNVAKPFGYMNGGSDSVKSVVNKQYNTPVKMYSDQTIAETLSAQTEVLAGGVLGVNFKKNEKHYDSEKSAVFKVLQEEQNDPEPEVSPPGGAPPVSGLRRVTAPVTRPDAPINNTGGLPPGQNICEECERLITGVFVRIKDKNLHVECFKCSTCGSSLKNQGYYNINGKLYCDIHAKLVARQNPPALNLEPVTVPPGGRIPSNVYSTPLPPLATNNYTNGSSSMFSPSSNLSGPKPFGSSLGSAYSPSLSPRSAPMSPARPVTAPAPAYAPAPAPAYAPAPAPTYAPAPAPTYAPAPTTTYPPAAPYAPAAAPAAPFAPIVETQTHSSPHKHEFKSPAEERLIRKMAKMALNGYEIGIQRKIKPADHIQTMADKIQDTIVTKHPLNAENVSSEESSRENTLRRPLHKNFDRGYNTAESIQNIGDKIKNTIMSNHPAIANNLNNCNTPPPPPLPTSPIPTFNVHSTPVVPSPLSMNTMKKPTDFIPKNLISSFGPDIHSGTSAGRSHNGSGYSSSDDSNKDKYENNTNSLRKNYGTEKSFLNGANNVTYDLDHKDNSFSNTLSKRNIFEKNEDSDHKDNSFSNTLGKRNIFEKIEDSDHKENSFSNTLSKRNIYEKIEDSDHKDNSFSNTLSKRNIFEKLEDSDHKDNSFSNTLSKRNIFEKTEATNGSMHSMDSINTNGDKRHNGLSNSNTLKKPSMFEKPVPMDNVKNHITKNEDVINKPSLPTNLYDNTLYTYKTTSNNGFNGSPKHIEIDNDSIVKEKNDSLTFEKSTNYGNDNQESNETETVVRRRQKKTERNDDGRRDSHIVARPLSTMTAVDVTDGHYPVCHKCEKAITRGPFITALGRIWCPEHFICTNATCKRPLQDIGFVEENGQLYCEYCFEQYIAPACDKCHGKIKGDCLNAIGKHYHPECFNCVYCGKLFGNNPFFLEDGLPYCEADWNELFTTKCFSCGFPVEAGDRWVEALNNNYHSQCFNCTVCKKNLEGQSFFAKGGRPFCKSHAR